MFGLSKREVLSNAIINASRSHIEEYKQAIKASADTMESLSEKDLDHLMLRTRRNYFDAVSNSVINTLSISSPRIATRIQLAMLSPALCGYEGIDLDSGLIAGCLYAICYYAIEGKMAAPKDCIKLNHLQGDIMNRALEELDDELCQS